MIVSRNIKNTLEEDLTTYAARMTKMDSDRESEKQI